MNPEKPTGLPTKVEHLRRILVSGLWAVSGLGVASPALEAQELKRDLPPGPCVSLNLPGANSVTPSEADRQEAVRLASEANQAAILGDLGRAIELLREATESDPSSSAVAYRLARALEDAGEAEAALGEFCRYLALEPDSPDAAETRLRAERLADPDRTPLPASARTAFQEGVTAYDEGAYDEAAQYFSRAIVESPDWDEAYYNRGVSYLGAGRSNAAAADLERYLEGNPDADDRETVEAQLRLIDPAQGQYSPGIALTTGLLLPGMGQFYTDQPRRGLLFLSTAGTAAAVGILHKKVEVECLQVPQDGICPPDQILNERVERPLLVPGLVVAGSISVLGAILAYRRAKDSDPQRAPGGGELEFTLPDFGSGSMSPSLRLEPAVWREGGGARLLLEIRF